MLSTGLRRPEPTSSRILLSACGSGSGDARGRGERVGFRLDDLLLVVEWDAAVAVRASLDTSGLLFVGEVRGVRENPQIIFALMREFGIGGLALKSSAAASGSVAAWRVGGPLPDDDDLWWGNGRATAGWASRRACSTASVPAARARGATHLRRRV
jgi:hypothetical protein